MNGSPGKGEETISLRAQASTLPSLRVPQPHKSPEPLAPMPPASREYADPYDSVTTTSLSETPPHQQTPSPLCGWRGVGPAQPQGCGASARHAASLGLGYLPPTQGGKAASARQHRPLCPQPGRAPALHMCSLPCVPETVPGDGCHHWLRSQRSPETHRCTALRRGALSRAVGHPPYMLKAPGSPSPCTAQGTAPGAGAGIATGHMSPSSSWPTARHPQTAGPTPPPIRAEE